MSVVALVIWNCYKIEDVEQIEKDEKITKHTSNIFEKRWTNYKYKEETGFPQDTLDEFIMLRYKHTIEFSALNAAMDSNLFDGANKTDFLFLGKRYNVKCVNSNEVQLEIKGKSEYTLKKCNYKEFLEILRNYLMIQEDTSFLKNDKIFESVVKDNNKTKMYYVLFSHTIKATHINVETKIKLILDYMVYCENISLYLVGFTDKTFDFVRIKNGETRLVVTNENQRKIAVEKTKFEDLSGKPLNLQNLCEFEKIFWTQEIKSLRVYFNCIAKVFQYMTFVDINENYSETDFKDVDDNFYEKTSLKVIRLFNYLRRNSFDDMNFYAIRKFYDKNDVSIKEDEECLEKCSIKR